MGDVATLNSINSLEISQPKNHGEPPTYASVVEKLFVPVEEIARNKQLQLGVKKRDVIQRYIREYRQSVGEDIYPVARLYLAKWDRQRVYMIKEFKLGKLVSDYLNLAKDSEDFKRIKGWKRLSYNRVHSAIKFSDLLVSVISRRRMGPSVEEGRTLTVNDVNDILDSLHEYAENSKEQQTAIFRDVFDRMTDRELKYFFRILLKSGPVGAEGTFLRCWHPDAERLYDLTHDLKTVFWGLTDPEVRLNDKEKHIRLNMPFTPQRCRRVVNEYTRVASDNFHDKPFFIEEKFDGERIQVHVERQEGGQFHFKYFTRNAIDYTSMYGGASDKAQGCLSPLLGPDNFAPNMKNCILDGEMICYDPVLKVSLPFSVVKASALQVLAEDNGKEDKTRLLSTLPHPMFVAFDCVYWNGSSLEAYPLEDRKLALRTAVKQEVPNLFVTAKYQVARTGEEIANAMSQAISTDSEGVVLKDKESKYFVASTSKEWIKIKPEYLEEFGENLDLVLIGKIPGIKTSFLCGLRDDRGGEDESNKTCKFVSMCKVSNGFSIEDYKYIDRETNGKWKDMASLGSDIVKFGKTLPMSWIDPKDSVVVEVRARAISRQPLQNSYVTDTTLYFAYCVKIRSDKDWKTASTLIDYETSSNQSKLHSEQNVFNKKRPHSAGQRSKKQAMISRENEAYVMDGKDEHGGLFDNYIFCIITDCEYKNQIVPVHRLNQIVCEHGGILARNPESVVLDTSKNQKLLLIADKITVEVRNLIARYNVFHFKWCEDCLAAGMLIAPDTSHLLSGEPSLLTRCEANLDEFGTNPLVPFNVHLLWDMAKRNLKDYDGTLVRSKFLVFNEVRFLFVYPQECHESVDILQELITMNGGEIVSNLRDSSYIVVYLPEEDYKCGSDAYYETMGQLTELLKKRGKMRGQIPRIVKSEFVASCVEEYALVDPASYKVPLQKEEVLSSNYRAEKSSS